MANALIPNQNILNRRGYSDEGIDLSLYQDRTGYGLAQLDPYGRVQIGGDPGLQEYLNYLAAPQTREVMGNVLADTIPVSAQGQAIERLKQQYSALQNAQSPIQAAVKAADMGLEGGALVADVLPYGKAAVTGLGALGALMSRKGVPEGIARAPQAARMTGTIGSTGAKTADLGALARAQELKASGASADDIYAQTRWWLDHPDGRPRFEIDDSGASMGGVKTLPEGPLGPMGMNLKHDELYKAYPNTKPIQLFGNNGYGGEYRKASDEITASNKQVALHELQHAIQGREGMAKGGSPETSPLIFTHPAQRNHYEDLVAKYEETLVKRENLLNENPYGDLRGIAKNELEHYDRLIDSIPKEINQMERGAKTTQYKKLAGEVEARLVESRMGMSMDDRLADPFYDNYDIPLRRQVIDHHLDSGIAQSADSLPMDEASRMARAKGESFSYGGFDFALPKADKGREIVMVPADKMESLWADVSKVGPAPKYDNQIKTRIADFNNWLDRQGTTVTTQSGGQLNYPKEAIELPRVVYLEDKGVIDFSNGRHRTRALMERGLDQIPVSVDKSEAAALRKALNE